MTSEQKHWIDNSTYEQLLERLRFTPVGDPWFQGDVGEYYLKVMARKRDENPAEAVHASKSVGWSNAGR
jgi:hypothetical protein